MVDAALHLHDMQREGKIGAIGVTNCDSAHLTALLDAGVPVATHQVQLSLLDRRPLGAMHAVCAAHGVRLLCYGALAGGFLHERWLGAPAPAEPLENRSLVKYRLIIDEFGGWDAYQALLRQLAEIATADGVTIGTVALRWVLDQPGSPAAIVGARNAAHLHATLAARTMQLTPTDHAALAACVTGRGPLGDVYDLERVKGGKHAVIMRTGLNAVARG
jgi:aryl-alcohol dehydrogenase-like predicted oxidoreductase